MMKKMKLADVPFGKNFEIWGHAYTVLDGDDKGVFVLEADTVCEMPFREENVESESAPNNFWDSSVRGVPRGGLSRRTGRSRCRVGPRHS